MTDDYLENEMVIKEMDRGATIEKRLDTMKQLYEAGIKTTCFISQIFPGITDVEAIIDRAKERCRKESYAFNWGGGWENVFFNVSCENQKRTD